MHLYESIARQINQNSSKVKETIALLDTGNTVPFIARYRKELTGGLDEEQIRQYVKWQLKRDRSIDQLKLWEK